MGLTDPRVLLNVHDKRTSIACLTTKRLLWRVSPLREMKRNSAWSTGLPLNAEVKLGKNFGEMEEWRP